MTTEAPKPCPVCGNTTNKDCPNMTLGQGQDDIDKLSSQGCIAAVAIIEVQSRTYGTAEGGNE